MKIVKFSELSLPIKLAVVWAYITFLFIWICFWIGFMFGLGSVM